MITISSFKSLEKFLPEIDKSTLVIFDIDDVIITASDTVFSPRGEISGIKDICLKQISKYIPIEYNKNSLFVELFTLYLQKSKRQIIDNYFMEFLDKLKKLSVSYIRLTGLEVGKYGVINSMEDWRYKDFRSLSIDLSCRAFESYESTYLQSNLDRVRPLYTDNIIYTDRGDKGMVLQNWLNHFKFKPSKILVIDDLLSNHISISNSCKKYGIEYKGIVYTGAQLLPVKISKTEALKQITILIEKKEWVCDEEIKLI